MIMMCNAISNPPILYILLTTPNGQMDQLHVRSQDVNYMYIIGIGTAPAGQPLA